LLTYTLDNTLLDLNTELQEESKKDTSEDMSITKDNKSDYKLSAKIPSELWLPLKDISKES